jgi:hypothetical protein
MSTTMRKTALDTIARMPHRPAPETFIGLLYTPDDGDGSHLRRMMTK